MELRSLFQTRFVETERTAAQDGAAVRSLLSRESVEVLVPTERFTGSGVGQEGDPTELPIPDRPAMGG